MTTENQARKEGMGMARTSVLPGPKELEILIRKKSQAEIAKEYGTTPQAVSNALRRSGLSGGRPVERQKWMPWTVADAHQRDGIMRALRDKVRLERGLHVDESAARRVEEMFETLKQHRLVIGYDREIGFFTTRRVGKEEFITERTPKSIDPIRFVDLDE